MKTIRNIGVVYVLLLVVQMFICNYFHFSAYITLSILPAMLMCLPVATGTVPAMLIAFATGLVVDALSDNVLGLNALALVPVGLCRLNIIRAVLSADVIERQEGFSFRKNGLGKISAIVVLANAVFFSVYILADGAGTRELWFNISRFFSSVLASSLVSLLVVNIVSTDE